MAATHSLVRSSYCPVGGSSGPWQCDSYKQLSGSSNNAAVHGSWWLVTVQRRQEAVTSQQQQMDSAAASYTETAPEPGLGWEFRQTMSNTSNWSTAACYMAWLQGPAA